jgi:4-amino-4-deoxy-L-arabinose transferase-like glycosyltransferase
VCPSTVYAWRLTLFRQIVHTVSMVDDQRGLGAVSSPATTKEFAASDRSTCPRGADPDATGPTVPVSSRGRWLVFAVLLAALALRLVVAASVQGDYEPRSDALDYDRIASSLAAGDGYGETSIPGAVGPSAFRAPGYPVVLAAVYAVVGEHSWTWGLVQNAVLGTIFAGLVGLVGSQLFGRRVGFVALVLASLHPTMVLFGTSLQIEPLLGSLELATLAAALAHRRRPERSGYVVATGVLLGATILTREIGIWLIPTVVLLVWTARPSPQRSWWPPAAVVVVAVLTVVPWTARNAATFDALVPVTTTSGVGLAGVYNDTAETNDDDPGLWVAPWFDPAVAEVMREDLERSEPELDRVLRSEAIDHIVENPFYVVRVAFWNTVRLFDLEGTDQAMFIRQFLPYPAWLTRLSVYASYVVYGLALFGATRRLARRAPLAVWLFPLLAWANLAVLSGNIRYRASIEPFLLLLAAVAVTTIVDRRASARDDRTGAVRAQ